ncbi:integrase core domain-containing protein [Spirosoma arcticum]
MTTPTKAQEAIRCAIEHYNRLRPHGSCDYHTPEQAHLMQGELAKRWRKPAPRNTEKVQHQEAMSVTQNES